MASYVSVCIMGQMCEYEGYESPALYGMYVCMWIRVQQYGKFLRICLRKILEWVQNITLKPVYKKRFSIFFAIVSELCFKVSEK